MANDRPKMKSVVRLAALVAIPLGALGSIGFMLHVGQRNESRLLLALFTGWVLAPFIVLTWCHVPAERWSESARAALHFVTLVLVLGSLAIYGYVALGPPRAKPAFFFLMIPLASLTLIALVAAMRTKNEKG